MEDQPAEPENDVEQVESPASIMRLITGLESADIEVEALGPEGMVRCRITTESVHQGVMLTPAEAHDLAEDLHAGAVDAEAEQ